MSNQQLHQFRMRLEHALNGLGSGDITGLELTAGEELERAQAEADAAPAMAALAVNRQTAKAIRLALRRIETSDYGVCASCEEPIGEGRLRALLWASRCIACQSASEEADEHYRKFGSLWSETPNAPLEGLQ